MNKQQLLENVLNNEWGTIGPKSISSAKLIAQRVSGQYGLLLHSASAALEAQLRSLEIVYGDEVIMASYSNPMVSMITAAVGATPVFVDIDPNTATLSPAAVEKAITSKTKAVIADIPGGNPCDAKKLAEICASVNVKLIINLGDGYDSVQNGKSLVHYAWGTVLDISDGTALPAGEGGALINNDEAAFFAGFAYHNCGRTPGAGSSLDMDSIVGGDLRIAEWQAAMVEANINELDTKLARRRDKAKEVLELLASNWLTPLPVVDGGVSSFGSLIFRYNKEKNNRLSIDTIITELRDKGYNACRPWRAMHRQPVFTSPYFKKLTGNSAGYSDEGLTNSIDAEETLVWIKL